VRITCLRCGHQLELPTVPTGPKQECPGCALKYAYPEIHNTGVSPSEWAAERLRRRAFRAAGLVKNTGGFALGLSALGILFFPLGIAGAALGVWVAAKLRGPLARYSGRREGLAAIALGIGAVVVWTSVISSWVERRRVEHVAAMRQNIREDLNGLLRAERLYRAGKDTYAGFARLRLENQHGEYTLYLGPDDFRPAQRDGLEVIDPLPPDLHPGVSETAFTAVAVGNLDSDQAVDVWVMTDAGVQEHVRDDLAEKQP
jgi:hypothetical protein